MPRAGIEARVRYWRGSLGFEGFCERIAYHVGRRLPGARYEAPASVGGTARLTFGGAGVTVWVRPSGFWEADFWRPGDAGSIAEPSPRPTGYRFDNAEAGELAIAIVAFLVPTAATSPQIRKGRRNTSK